MNLNMLAPTKNTPEAVRLLPHRRSTSLPHLRSLLTLLVNTLGKQLSIVVSSILGCFRPPALQCNSVTLVLETLWGDETLDSGCLGVWFLAFSL